MATTNINSPVDSELNTDKEKASENSSTNEGTSNHTLSNSNEVDSLAEGGMICPHCRISFSNEGKLLDHIQLMHNRKENQTHCHLCSMVTDDDLAIEMHILQEHQVTTYKCGQCFYAVYKLEYLVNHITLRHSQSSQLTQHEALSLMKHSVCTCLLDKMKMILPAKRPTPLKVNNSPKDQVTVSQPQQASTTECQPTSPTANCSHSSPHSSNLNNNNESTNNDDQSKRSSRKRIRNSKYSPSKFTKLDFLDEGSVPGDENDDASSVGENIKYIKYISYKALIESVISYELHKYSLAI